MVLITVVALQTTRGILFLRLKEEGKLTKYKNHRYRREYLFEQIIAIAKYKCYNRNRFLPRPGSWYVSWNMKHET